MFCLERTILKNLESIIEIVKSLEKPCLIKLIKNVNETIKVEHR